MNKKKNFKKKQKEQKTKSNCLPQFLQAEITKLTVWKETSNKQVNI